MSGKLVQAFTALALFYPVPLASAEQITVHALRQVGWTVVDKSAHDEWLDGKAPYHSMRRLLYVVTYTLQKDGKAVTCRLTRDVMYDTSTETCVKAK